MTSLFSVTLMQDTLTYGYNDYRDDEPSETIVNLMNEIREDINVSFHFRELQNRPIE